ncbi:MAG: hypothetical protein APU95_03400 [Hadesarchaea archaeon YNP_N21]|jgi:SHS2 domain-containing protein|nr:MAG: hypothetical protein APU95_03400 [Hadesarchaea archaeon YNP_N21]
MKKFEVVEHPSDVGFKAYGKDLAEAFENAALAFFEVMVDTRDVMPVDEFSIEIEAEDKYSLLYDWLERLLYLHDAFGAVMAKFKVEEISPSPNGFRLRAKAWGEKLDLSRHNAKVAVKAITYHMMEIKEEKDHCTVQAVVDI